MSGHRNVCRSELRRRVLSRRQELFAYDPSQLEYALQVTLVNNATAILAQRDTLLQGVVLTSTLVDKLMQYMSALTDDRARSLSRVVPVRVPSGLPVDRP